jgi:hypothetical protein
VVVSIKMFYPFKKKEVMEKEEQGKRKKIKSTQ